MPEFDIATLDEMVAFLDCAARPPPSMALTSDPVLENVTRYLEQGLTPVAAHLSWFGTDSQTTSALGRET